jgi:(p)ppGpp synthase/HD superfamily hydrolase
MQGAKVNSKLVSFETSLHNGDVVEILRREAAHPSAKWLEVAKTTLAKKCIRTALGLTEPDIQKEPRALRPRRKRTKPQNS